MTQDEYYKILKERWEQVDQSKLEEIKAYNEFKRMLRTMMEEE